MTELHSTSIIPALLGSTVKNSRANHINCISGIVLEIFMVNILHKNKCAYNCRSIIWYISGSVPKQQFYNYNLVKRVKYRGFKN